MRAIATKEFYSEKTSRLRILFCFMCVAFFFLKKMILQLTLSTFVKWK